MLISVVNHTSGGRLSDKAIQEAIRAVNRQIVEDFEPYWSMKASLRLEGKIGTGPNKELLAELRGDALIYLWDKEQEASAEGYHDRNNEGIPYSFVFVDREAADWTVTLSHEALEMIADPEANLLVAGPDPHDKDKTVYHWYEMCDAVQGETYEVDGIKVSNFVLPLYFTTRGEEGSRNDFLGKKYGSSTLESFGINPGGYIGYFDPQSPTSPGIFTQGNIDLESKVRRKISNRGHRLNRYMRHTMQPDTVLERKTKPINVLFIHGLNTDEADYRETEDKITHILQDKLQGKSFKIENVDYLAYNEFFSTPDRRLDSGEFVEVVLEYGLAASFGISDMFSAAGDIISEKRNELEAAVRNVWDRLTGKRPWLARVLGNPTDADKRFLGLFYVCQLLHDHGTRAGFVEYFNQKIGDTKYDLIIGHSFGAISSYYAMLNGARIKEPAVFLTVGSQIGQSVFDPLYRQADDIRPMPACISRWLNLFNPQDLVYVQDLKLKSADGSFESVLVEIPTRNPGEEHDLYGYLEQVPVDKLVSFLEAL